MPRAMNRSPNVSPGMMSCSRPANARSAGAAGSGRIHRARAGHLSRPSRSLLSDAQFTWGEQVMGIIALLSLSGCALAASIVGRLIKVAAGIVEVLVDGAEYSWRTNELIEQHLIPTLAALRGA